MTSRLIYTLVITMLLLHGCGQTGDLYLPEDPQVEVDEEEEKQSD